MSSSTADTNIDACANCGKAETDAIKLKRCTACKMVRYCSKDCQVAHRPQHKKACKKRAAEIFDEELFKDHPEREECPICMLPIPFEPEHSMFQACCGKTLCLGCIHAQRKVDASSPCAFCRTPPPSADEETINRLNRGVERKDGESMHQLALHYRYGKLGLKKDSAKALRLLLEAGKYGSAHAYYIAGNFYKEGHCVKKDLKRAKHYWELGAIGGSIHARNNLGCSETDVGNFERACKHFLISAKAGHKNSLNAIKVGVKDGFVKKHDYGEALRLYQKLHDDTRSAMRDEASKYVGILYH